MLKLKTKIVSKSFIYLTMTLNLGINFATLYADDTLLEGPNLIGPQRIVRPKHDWEDKPAKDTGNVHKALALKSVNMKRSKQSFRSPFDDQGFNAADYKNSREKDSLARKLSCSQNMFIDRDTSHNRRGAISGEHHMIYDGQVLKIKDVLPKMRQKENLHKRRNAICGEMKTMYKEQIMTYEQMFKTLTQDFENSIQNQ